MKSSSLRRLSYQDYQAQGKMSQGLILPVESMPGFGTEYDICEDCDVTDLLT
jgi:hypothetical protein